MFGTKSDYSYHEIFDEFYGQRKRNKRNNRNSDTLIDETNPLFPKLSPDKKPSIQSSKVLNPSSSHSYRRSKKGRSSSSNGFPLIHGHPNAKKEAHLSLQRASGFYRELPSSLLSLCQRKQERKRKMKKIKVSKANLNSKYYVVPMRNGHLLSTPSSTDLALPFFFKRERNPQEKARAHCQKLERKIDALRKIKPVNRDKSWHNEKVKIVSRLKHKYQHNTPLKNEIRLNPEIYPRLNRMIVKLQNAVDVSKTRTRKTINMKKTRSFDYDTLPLLALSSRRF